MKWKKGFTAEEAALVVAGFHEASSIEEVEIKISNGDYQYDEEDLWNCAKDAQQILNSLLLEACRIEQGYPSTLEVFLWFDEQSKIMFTAESLARWFYDLDGLDSARRILPNFNEPDLNSDSLRNSLAFQFKKENLNQKRCTSIDLPFGGSEESIEKLKAENAALKVALFKLKSLYSVSSNSPEEDKKNFSDYIPVIGKDLQILSRAFQDFPARFPYYETRPYSKKVIMEWLSSSYSLTERASFTFADILMQNFLIKE